MKKYFLTGVVLSLLTTQLAWGQNDPTLLTVDGVDVTKSEFENIYKKNNKEVEVTKASLDEYLELFVNFKLKVREAEELGMDTVTKFVKELQGYRAQLARPYLVDNEMSDELIKEAYDRLTKEVRASHILIKVAANAAPEDTAAAYKKIMELRKRIVAGEDFAKVAKGPGGSEDPSAAKNGGDLGYFTALQMVYPFENAAFETPVGEVSNPLRTRFGYHIIKVVDKREARGTIRTSHILVQVLEDASNEEKAQLKSKIEEIYGKLQQGEDFATLARQHSNDQGSARKGGELPWFGAGRMVEEFENQAFALKEDGQYSRPFETKFGWHIVKRLERKGIAPFSEEENRLKVKIQRDSRSQLTKSSFIAKLKKEYNYVEYPKSWKEIYKQADTTLYSGKWVPAKVKKLSKVLYSFDGEDYTQVDFAEYLIAEQRVEPNKDKDLKTYIDEKYKRYINDMILDYEDKRLEAKYADFRMLMKEYRDGILLFELTDEKVWSKAVKDTSGLDAFYAANKNDFMWGERLEAATYTCANPKIAKTVRKMKAKGKGNGEIVRTINADSQLNLRIESKKYERGDDPTIDKMEWKKGLSDNQEVDGQVVFLEVKEVIPPTPKKIDEARGLITAAYQTHLEEAWIKSLKERYEVQVNKDVLYSIK